MRGDWTVRAPRALWLIFSIALVLSNAGLWWLGSQLQQRVATIDEALMQGTAVTLPAMWHRRFDAIEESQKAIESRIGDCCSHPDYQLLPEMGETE